MSRDNTIESTLFLGANNKFKELVNCLLKCQKEESYQSYHLILVSCYFRCRSAQELIEAIRDKINPLKLWVEIYIDPRDALKIGKQELCNWKSNLESEELKISVHIFDRKAQSNLFHPKAYCLISCKEDRRNCNGSLVVGSPNLTGRGLTKDNSNIELLLDTQSREHIKNFYKSLKRIDFIEIQNLNVWEFTDSLYDSYIDEDEFPELEDESYCFCFRLLSLGYLVHPWKTNLSKPFKVVYSLKEQQNTKIKKEEPQLDKLLSDLKFTKKAQQKTITKDYTPNYAKKFLKERPSKFIKLNGNYGVETLLGYWIPKHKVAEVRQEDLFKEFQDNIIFRLAKDLNEIGKQISSDWTTLQSYVTEGDKSQKTINSLRIFLKDESFQQRIYQRYGICDLPYRIWQKQEVENLYKSLIDSCHNLSSNDTKKAILKVLDDPQRDLSPIISL